MRKTWILSILVISMHNIDAKQRQNSEQKSAPYVTAITSLYKGGAFIKGFMENLIEQTIFNECEFVIISAHSPDEHIEDQVIIPYTQRYSNIRYIKLSQDPGLYAVWNMAIQYGHAAYIINLNVDDFIAPYALEVLAHTLDLHPEIDLVYAPSYISKKLGETFAVLHERPIKIILDWPDFSPRMMRICLPGNHPMWRRSMHEKYGYFDAEYRAAGDWEFFLRAVGHGACFIKIHQVLGTFYQSGTCLTQSKIHGHEVAKIEQSYSYIWNT